VAAIVLRPMYEILHNREFIDMRIRKCMSFFVVEFNFLMSALRFLLRNQIGIDRHVLAYKDVTVRMLTEK
jgi:hypothetical protein